jgi:hypothetical protein
MLFVWPSMRKTNKADWCGHHMRWYLSQNVHKVVPANNTDDDGRLRSQPLKQLTSKPLSLSLHNAVTFLETEAQARNRKVQ